MEKVSKRLITAEDLYEFKVIGGVRLSPDGSKVIFTQQRVDKASEKKYTNLWLSDVRTGKTAAFTQGDHSDHSPVWSPDGKTIAFLSNRDNKEKPAQIYLIAVEGGEARRLTDIKGGIGGLSWSPDGKQLLCSVTKTDQEVLDREADERKKKLGTVVRVYDRIFYKRDGEGFLGHERQHIWVVDALTGEGKQLTDHKVFDEVDPAWSPDGKSIVYVSNLAKDPDFAPDKDELFVMPAAGGKARKVATEAGGKGAPVFSPDGKWIAYFGGWGEGEGWRNTYLWLAPADGSAKPVNLTIQFDLHIDAAVINDVGSPEMMSPIWSKDGRKIYFQVAYHGSSLLKVIDIKSAKLDTVIGEGGAVGSVSFDKAQSSLAYFFGNFTDPAQVKLLDLKTGKSKLLYSANADLLKQLDLGSVEEVWYKSESGMDLQGWILKPPSFDKTKKYPSILEIHGGPQTQYGKFFMHEFYYFASKGYVVHFTNPRGGRGYGEEHTRAIWGGWGTADYQDLMTWTDLVAKKPYIETSRMFVTGGSYGGYMTVWIIGHTQRFKAAVTQRCVSNFLSMWGSSDFNWVFQRMLGARQPFFDFEKFWEQSPIAYIGNAKTPTKVIHNEEDHRCPIEQGEQVFVALKSLNVPTQFVRFPGEPHGLSRVGRTDRRIERLNHIVGWFDKYLK